MTKTMTWTRPRQKKLTKTKGQKQLRPKQQNKPKRLRDEGARDEGDRKKKQEIRKKKRTFLPKEPDSIMSKEILYDWSTEDNIVVYHKFLGNYMCIANYDVTTKRLRLFAHSPFINVYILHPGQTLNLQGSVQQISVCHAKGS